MNLEALRALGLVETRACRHGKMSFLRTDQWIAQALGYYGEFSQAEIDVWDTLLREGDNVVTAGANIGAHVVWFAKRVGGGRVITAEPQGVLYEILQENIAQNELANVEAHRAALGRDRARAALPAVDYRYSFSFGSLGAADVDQLGTAAVVVDVVTIDELLDGRPARLIHLDVEGGEVEALQGASGTITRHRPYLYLECDRPGQSETLFRALGAIGYEALMHRAPLYNRRNFAENGLNIFGDTVSISLLGIPKGAA